MGTIRLHRAYYHCRHCGRGMIPWDDALHLGPHALTPGAAEVVSLAGALDSFAEAGSLALRKMAGLSASESTVERVSEATGRDIGRRQADGEVFGPPQPWRWHKDAEACYDESGKMTLWIAPNQSVT